MASQLFSNDFLCLVIFREVVIQVKYIIMQNSLSVPPKNQGKINHAWESGHVCGIKSLIDTFNVTIL